MNNDAPITYLADFPPRFCPGCGKRQGLTPSFVKSFAAQISFICACGCSFQHVERARLIETAHATGGDLE